MLEEIVLASRISDTPPPDQPVDRRPPESTTEGVSSLMRDDSMLNLLVSKDSESR